MSRRHKSHSDSITRAVRALAPDQLAGIHRHAEARDARALRQRLQRIERRTGATGLDHQANAARTLATAPVDRVIAATLARHQPTGPRRTRDGRRTTSKTTARTH